MTVYEKGMKVRFFADRAPGIDMDAEGAAWDPELTHEKMDILDGRPVKEGVIFDTCMNLYAIECGSIRHMVVVDDIICVLSEASDEV